MAAQRISTAVGDLYVETEGDGPPAVLWHSLFVDSTSFELLRPLLTAQRSLIVIDGPGHGRSGPPSGLFTIDDCAHATEAILEYLGICGPVDWVGNAWGGHVGLALAAEIPQRIRSLVTIGTPVQAVSTSDRLTQIYPLLAIYRLAGPVGLITKALTDILLGAHAVAAQPDLARRVIAAFTTADRPAMLTAMRSAMVRRKTFTRLSAVAAPTLMVVGRDDPTCNGVMAEAAAAQMPLAATLSLRGEGHVAPLLTEPELLGSLISEFWKAPTGCIRTKATKSDA